MGVILRTLVVGTKALRRIKRGGPTLYIIQDNRSCGFSTDIRCSLIPFHAKIFYEESFYKDIR